jgi:L-aspartate oxidase
MASATPPETANGLPETQISTAVKKRVKRLMWERVGIIRDKSSLQRALREFEQISRSNLSNSSRNFVTLAMMVARAALWREESRGGHFRSDFPEKDENFRAHSIQKEGAGISSAKTINFRKATAS